MRFVFIVLLLLLLTGCATTKPVTQPLVDFFTGGTEEVVEDRDPIEEASYKMTRYGVICIALGAIWGAFTRFRTGWGLSLAAAGVIMILIAWTFDQPWAPWAGLSTLVAYGFYKYHNKMNPDTETEHPLI